MINGKKQRSSLEREVIVALTLLYMLIMGAVLVIYYSYLGLEMPERQAVDAVKE